MATHQNAASMAVEAIEEHLAIAEYCVNTVKPGSNGVYGFTAVLLLFSVVDALSNFLGYPENSLGALKAFEPKLSHPQVKSLKQWFRNPSSHQAMIVPGTKLTLEEGDPFEFSGTEPSHIRVRPFFCLVKNAWKQFDRNKITATFDPKKKLPQTPVTFTGASTAAPIASSGCYVTSPASKAPKR
jgi:hypothetical protein